MNPLVTQLWPQFNADAAFAQGFAGVLVERVELLRQSRKVLISLQSARPLDPALCGRLTASLSGLFAGCAVALQPHFPYASLTPEGVRSLIFELRDEGLLVNGFLDKAAIELENERVTIHLAAGKTLLEEIGFPEKLAGRIAERTGTRPEVVLRSGKAVPQQEWEAHIQQKAPAVQFEQKKTAPPIKIPACRWPTSPPGSSTASCSSPQTSPPLASSTPRAAR